MIEAKENATTNGSDYGIFCTELEDISHATKSLICRGSEITFLSLSKYERGQEYAEFYVLNPETVADFIEEGLPIPTIDLAVPVGTEPYMEECKRTTNLLIKAGERAYFTSNLLNGTIGERAGVGGVETTSRQNLVRNLHFADAIFSRNEKIHFVYRDLGVRKIFAAMGAYFKPVEQNILKDIADTIVEDGLLGRQICEYWSIDHEFTDVCFEYPDKALDIKETYELSDTLTPKLCLSTSDIGSSSIIIRAKLGAGRGNVTVGEWAFKHSKELSTKKILKTVDEELFSAFRKLPEVLTELIGKEVYDKDLSIPANRDENIAECVSLCEYVARKLLIDGKIMGKKSVDALMEALACEFNGAIRYTYYDIALIFMELSSRISGVSRDTVSKLEKSLAKAPFLLKEKAARGKTVIALTA